MTSKDKAIEALDKLGEKAHITQDDMKVYIDDTTNEPYKSLNEYKTVSDYLTQPTLDDAIKVVEKHRSILEPHRHIDVCAPYALSEIDDILTALKGLKEGKK